MTLRAEAVSLVDAEVRERLLTDLERTFFVEAGAGTGKTTILVGRIVSLVASGRVDMEHLAAITFTEAAAAELRDRVREALERAAVDSARDAEQRARCRRAAGEIDLAAISTIHAFAANLLRTYPLEAGLPPGFATLDEIEQGLLFEERFKAWFWQDALAEPARSILSRALLLGLTQDRLRALAAALEEQHDLLGPETTWDAPEPQPALPLAHRVGTDLQALESWTVYALDGDDDPVVRAVTRAQMPARRLLQAATEDEALAAMIAMGKHDAWSGTVERWASLPDGRNACNLIKKALRDVNVAVAEALEAHRSATLARVLVLLRDFTLAGVRRRKADGVASFQDLLAWARDLLRDRPEARHFAQARYQRIFIDEFQDTDPLQAEIAFYLAADERQPLAPDWRDFPLVPGKLFIVGDPKQSIYRFRRADIGVYDDLLQRLAPAQEHLVQNFRSVRPVLDWVNYHFEAQMRPAVGRQPRYVALASHREPFEADSRCGVYRLGGRVEGSAVDAAQAEADALARTALAAIEEGWLVADADGLRAAMFRDICVLLPTRTHLRRLERALEAAGVPYRLEAGKLVLATQEVRDLLACLRAIEDPSDQVALVAALRSPAYACSDVDLLTWAEGGGRLDHEQPGEGPDGRVKDALASLAGFHARRHLLSPPALIETFVHDRLLIASAFGEPRPREAWRRLRYVVSRARAFTSTGRHTLRAFLDWIEGLQRAEVRDPESGSAESDEDALHIQTVHGAKGLEYPIVLLGGLGTTRGNGFNGVDVIADRGTGRLACSAGQGWHTPDYAGAQAREKAMADAESIRLLYVATTRARDHLVVSLYHASRAADSSAARIERRLAACPELCQALDLTTGATEVLEATPGTIDVGDCDETAWLAARGERINALASAPVCCNEPAVSPEVRHLVRRYWTDPRSLTDQSAAADTARLILASAPVVRARSAERVLHAVPLCCELDGAAVEDTADLIYATPAGPVLVALVPASVPDGQGRAARLDLIFRRATGRSPAAVELVCLAAEPARAAD